MQSTITLKTNTCDDHYYVSGMCQKHSELLAYTYVTLLHYIYMCYMHRKTHAFVWVVAGSLLMHEVPVKCLSINVPRYTEQN